MAFRSHDRTKVPALSIVEARVASVSADLAVEDTAYDFDSGTYRLQLFAKNGRSTYLDLSRELLEDLRDNLSGPKTKFSPT